MISPTQHSTSSRNAWVLLVLAAELYILSQVLFVKLPILIGTALGQLLCLALPAILYAKWKTGSVKQALRLRPVSGAIGGRVILLALTAMGAASMIEQMTQPLITHFCADWIPLLKALERLLTPETKQGLLANLLVIGLIAPVCEELLFRGAFQGSLEQRGPVRAIAFTAVAFGVIHLNPFNLIGPILFGVGIGMVVWRTGSILPAILWHALNNTVAVLMMGIGGNDFTPPWWVNGGLTILFVLLLWEFILQTRRSVPLLSPLATTPAVMPGRVFRLLKIAGLACAILLLSGASCLGRGTFGHDRFSPDYAADDIAFYTRDFLGKLIEVQVNDIVYWKDANTQRTYSERVVKVDGDQVTLGISPEEGAPYEVKIKRSEVLGKYIGKISPSEEVRSMMREIKAKPTKKRAE